MKPSVYIETTIASYLTARLSNDLIAAGYIAETRKWWDLSQKNFELYTSEVVIQEASAGDQQAASERVAALSTVTSLALSDDATLLAKALVSETALPQKARIDALHVGIAAVNSLHYLLTWNCRHLANATLRTRIEQVCRDRGFRPPIICTPSELSEVLP